MKWEAREFMKYVLSLFLGAILAIGGGIGLASLIVFAENQGRQNQPVRQDLVIVLPSDEKGRLEAQEKLERLSAEGWKVIEDNELQARTDAVFLWRFVPRE
jgi:histidyl-tRNA synthetase